MANATDNMPASAQKYEGPGKLSTAVDSGISWSSIIGGLGLVFAASGKAVNFKLLNWVSVGVGAVAAYFGYSSAAKGEKQFESMKSQLAQSQMQVAELQTKVADISREAASNRKSFTQHVDSRSAHGSHASVVDADKSVAATAEAAR